MARSSFHLSLCLVAIIACLSPESARAGLSATAEKNSNQLYHERKESSNVEKNFNQLPSIENEVESLFDEVSFYSAFQPSPLVDQTEHNNEIEDVFRRALQFQPTVNAPTFQGAQGTRNRGTSFLGGHLQEVGVFGGVGARRGGVRGSGGQPPLQVQDQVRLNGHGPIPKTGKQKVSSLKMAKSTKSIKFAKDKHKQFKKDKRYKGEKRDIDHKLTKSGKKDEKFSYDPYDADDDNFPLHDDWTFDSWSWEWVEEDDYEHHDASAQFKMPDSSTQQSSGFGGALGGMRGWQAGTINSDISETMMGRMDLGGFSSISNWKPASEAIGAIPQQTNHMLHQTDEASQSNGVTTAQTNHYGQVTQMGGVSSHTGVTTAHANHNSQPSVQTGEASQSIQATTSQSNHNSQPAQTVGSSQSIGATTAQYDYNSQPTQTGGASQSKGATTAPYNHVTKSNQLNFPTIQHMVFSGPIHLKAHSPVDVSTMDPEIFAILQSILTPYLQETMGPTLHAYTLEVNYSPGHGKNVGKDVVETLIEVNCAFKVISDSVESFKSINHVQASRWIHDFFAGPEIYKLLEALRTDNIPVNDITFVDQAFQVSATVAEANSQMASGRYPVSKNNEKSSNGAFIGITLSVVIVGMIFFLHHTGRLPSKAQVGAFSLTARDSVAKHGATARHSIAKHSKSARKSIAKCIPSSMKRKESRLGKYTDDEVEGGRRRTYSGTFRRHPPGGLQKAALQKKPARSEEYLGESASTSSSSAGGAARSCRKSSSFTDMLEQDDYSFSNFEGDYEPSICAPSTPSRRTYNGDEASMTDTLGYDSSAHSRSLLDKVSNTVSQAASLLSPGNSSYKQQDASRSPIPSSAPRRVTAADIASPNDADNWSIQSYQTKTPSRRSPSNHPLYRGWNDSGPELRMQKSEINDSEESPGRKRLNIPRFT